MESGTTRLAGVAKPKGPSAPVQMRTCPEQLSGSPLALGLLRTLGWTLQFDGMPARQGVVIAYPHTSNWDFLLAMTARWAMGLPVTFWGKDSLFRVPLLGRWMRWLGGVPVDRGAPRGVVGQMVQAMAQARQDNQRLWLALSPEGTRSRTEGWRSGFYRVAVDAQVPVTLAYMDYANKRVGVDSHWMLSGDEQADYAMLRERLGAYRGLRPDLAAPIQALDAAARPTSDA